MEQPSQEWNKHLKKSSAIAMVWVCEDLRCFIAGGLSPQGFQTLTAAVKRHWLDSTQKDPYRYVGLALDGKLYILHAKVLPQKNCVLGLAFPFKTSLSRIRKDTAQLMRSSLETPKNQFKASTSLERSLQFIPQSNSDAEPGWVRQDNQSAEPIEDVHLPEKKIIELEETEADAIAQKKILHTSRKTRQSGYEQASPSGMTADFSLEIPEISWQPVGDDWLEPDEKTPEPHCSSTEALDSPGERTLGDVWQPLAEMNSHEDDLISLLQDDYDLREDLMILDEGLESPERSARPVQDEWLSPSDKSSHTDNLDMDLLVWTEKVSDVTFYLVPGHDSQYLLGDLAHRLRDWLPAICSTYGWELDFLSIRPDYMKWTLHDFPESLILEMLRIIREQLSEKIYRVFPHLLPNNQLKDFWSPGYLVDTQNREFSTQALITHVSSGRLAYSTSR